MPGATLTRTVRRPQAIRDIAAIWRHIAQDDERAADRLVERIDAILDMLADQPGIGTPRDSWSSGVRSFVTGRYLVIYQPIRGGVRLLRVLHGARDLRGIAFD